jgi:hypothetical protein
MLLDKITTKGAKDAKVVASETLTRVKKSMGL